MPFTSVTYRRVHLASRSAAFDRDGFLIVGEGFIVADQIERLRERFEAIFREEYETGIRPDEVNWVAGRDPEDRTRQICNGWKADTLARRAGAERAHRPDGCAQLMGYDGVRILQDNCIWKPPGTMSLGMHQDGAYLDYLHPGEMITCWIALDDTSAEAGTMTFVTRLAPLAAIGEEPRRVPRAAGLAGAGPPGQSRPAPTPSSTWCRWSSKAGGASFHHHNLSTARGRTRPRPPTGGR